MPVIERFEVAPEAGAPGTMIEILVEVDDVLLGMTAVDLSIDGVSLGGPLLIERERVSVTRMMPDLPPGEVEITVSHAGTALASVPFQVTEYSGHVVVASLSPGLATVLVVETAVVLFLVGGKLQHQRGSLYGRGPDRTVVGRIRRLLG